MESNNTHRFEHNPMEQRLHQLFVQDIQPIDVARIVKGTHNNGQAKGDLTDEESAIAPTIVQWLASPAGLGILQQFVREFPEWFKY